MKKPEARGPKPSEKAKKALGEKLNRPPKPAHSRRFAAAASCAAEPSDQGRLTGMEQNPFAALEPMARVIEQQLARRPEHFISHPSELKLFQAVSDEELRRFAHDHGWRVVRRVGGRQIEFYNDATMRWRAARAGKFPSGTAAPIR
jgi:hypothetical protein